MVDNSDDVLGYADANHVVLMDYFTQMLIFIEKGGINVSLIISFFLNHTDSDTCVL